jgi:hypothetical protein
MLKRGMYVDPRKHIIQMTTNGCSLSKDLMIVVRCLHSETLWLCIQKVFGRFNFGDIEKINQDFSVQYFRLLKNGLSRQAENSTIVHESSFTAWAQC